MRVNAAVAAAILGTTRHDVAEIIEGDGKVDLEVVYDVAATSGADLDAVADRIRETVTAHAAAGRTVRTADLDRWVDGDGDVTGHVQGRA